MNNSTFKVYIYIVLQFFLIGFVLAWVTVLFSIDSAMAQIIALLMVISLIPGSLLLRSFFGNE